MDKSYVITMPDLKELSIPEKQRSIYVKDSAIFSALRNEKRHMEDRTEPAQNGDYVLTEVVCGDVTQLIHIELGGRHFPQQEAALLGCRTGDVISAVINGEQTILRVRSVRKTEEYPITDASIEALNIEDVHCAADYRRKYIRENGFEMSEKLFRAMQQKLIENLVDLAEFHLDEDDVTAYHENQKSMIQNLTGDVNLRLLTAYGEDGKYSLEECDRMFMEENKRTYQMILWSKALAEQNHVKISETDRKAAIENYCLVFDTTEDEITKSGKEETAMYSFYIAYGMKELRRYYCSVIGFCAEGVDHEPCPSRT